jgi:glycosyltransferase involved in cell wall biosynthesis
MKIALVHDYFAQDGGAELVFRTFYEIWPEATIFVLFNNKGSVPGFEHAKIKESFLAKLPFVKKHYQWYLPLMTIATEHHDFKEFDIVLSSTSAFAKGIITHPGTIHICYCHTPTRYLWTDTQEYIASLKYNKIVKIFLPFLLNKLRMWDKIAAGRVDGFLANSKEVSGRIKKYYGRTSHIVYPAIDTTLYTYTKNPDDYYVIGGRIAAYKRFDLVIHVFNRLGWKLKVFGVGPRWWKDIQKSAKSNIEFLGRVTDEEKAKLFKHAKGFIHPQEEDFGMMPTEAMASGCPVLAYRKGGAIESISEGKIGLFFDEQDWYSLMIALLSFDKKEWDRKEISEYARRFDKEYFKKEIKAIIEQACDRTSV